MDLLSEKQRIATIKSVPSVRVIVHPPFILLFSLIAPIPTASLYIN